MNFLSAYPALQWAVPASAHAHYYTTFYVLAFGLNLLLLLREGWRRGYAMRSWLVVLASSTLAFILGTKLLAFSGAEWQQLLTTGQWPAAGARTVLGGAISGTLVLLALRKPFGFSWHMFDAFALPMCVALTIQCVGCVLTGCCFGELTDGSWGLTYGPGTWPYVAQAMRGAIPLDATHSLPVHPTQLYTLLLCAGVGILLVFTRHKLWPGGSRNLLHLGLLLAGRWLIEFWRDPASEPVGGALHEHAGLVMNQLQWVLLMVTPLVLGFWLWRVRQRPTTGNQYENLPSTKPTLNLLLVALLLLITAWLGGTALARPEVLVMKALLLALLTLEAGAALQGSARQLQPGRVALPLVLASGVFLLTSQVPLDSTTTTLEITAGAGNGTYFEDVEEGGGGCSGPVTRTTYDHRYVVRGGTVELHKDNAHHTTFGVGVWRGQDKIHYQAIDPITGTLLSETDSTHRLFSINPYAEWSTEVHPGKFGLGYRAGLHVGRLRHQGQQSDIKNTDFRNVTLDLGAWIGVREKLYLQADVNRGGLGVGNPTARLGLGSGLGRLDGRHVLMGMAFAKNQPDAGMGFVSADLRLGRTGFTLYPYAATNFARLHQLNLRVGYRIPLKKK
ncbi:prolipoprotein diacylglyceryl transferase family protein [Hymenobacter pini]|uniref:prolipoprotein diacylglyceryl transferase family protein n=1 Tax=Hymenobacter pini TaxID=2880879 RepID=UPI001CF13B01|nr:prolipoprotein diacylglyceryl transferase family protein [Hymenobacter pini]MCA8829691.1 prolipoprotein diacylglyceryl transferase [Hymenobacter pini]